MSKDNVARFLSRAGAVEQEAIKQAVAGSKDPAKAVAAIVSVAHSQGDDFTAEEFVELMTFIQRQLDGELSDEELEGVAGGVAGMSSFSTERIHTAATEIFDLAGVASG